jgi:hypothetical protein
MQDDYMNHIPTEIFEQILSYLDGVDLGKLKRSSKKFKNSLDNPTAWRMVFDDRFKSLMEGMEYFDEENINWSAEMNRLARLRKYTKIASKHRLSVSGPSEPFDLKVFENHLIIDNYAPIDINMRKNCPLVPKYEGHIIMGGYSGRQEADQQGGHQIYDLFTEKTPFVYKKLFETTRGVLTSLNKTLAVLDHAPKNDSISIWNLSVVCKHTDEVLWKRTTKKKEFCKECAFICNMEYVLEENYTVHFRCSQVNQKVILSPTFTSLHVIRPLKGASFYIPNDDTCHITWHTENINHFDSSDGHRVEAEQMVNIDGKPHHIVHCVIGREHRFYDLTDKKMMAAISSGTAEKWIPNTCYFAAAGGEVVVVIDFSQKKIISRFRPTIALGSWAAKNKGTFRDSGTILAMTASRSDPVLFIAKRHSMFYVHTRVLMCSAVTGVQIVQFCRTNMGTVLKMELSEDEKTLIVQGDKGRIDFFDLRDALLCLRPNFKRPKQ